MSCLSCLPPEVGHRTLGTRTAGRICRTTCSRLCLETEATGVVRRYRSSVEVPERLRTPPSEVALAAVVTAVMAVDIGQAARPVLAFVAVLLAGMTLAWRLVVPELPLAAICLV